MYTFVNPIYAAIPRIPCLEDPVLRKKFTGQPEHLINFLFMVAEEAREIMASLGIKKFNDLIGRTDLLRPKGYLKDNPKTADLDFAELLKPAWTMESMMGNSGDNPMFCCEPQALRWRLRAPMLDDSHAIRL